MKPREITETNIRVNLRLTFQGNVSDEQVEEILENVDYNFFLDGKEIVSSHLNWDIEDVNRI